MINVTSAFINALNNDNRDYREVIEMTLKNGATLTLANEHIWSGTFHIDDAVSSDNELQIGSAVVNRFDFTINNLYDDFSQYDFYGARVVVKVALLINGSLEVIRKGTYVVAEDPVYNGDLIKVTCYDYMYFFDVPYSSSLTSYPATADTIIRNACTDLGITLATYTFPNRFLTVSSPPDKEATTYREVIAYVAQMCGCYARCNRNGGLELKWFNRTELESVMENLLDGGEFDSDGLMSCHYISSLYSHDISVDDVVITGIRILVKTESNGAADSIKTFSRGTSTYVIEIKNNPFITEANVSSVLDALAPQLIGLTYRRAKITHGSNPTMEAGDIAILCDRKQNIYPILITHTAFAVGSPQSTTSAAQTPVHNSTARYGVETKTYVELRKRIQNERTTRETIEAQLRQNIADASGLYVTQETDSETGGTITYLHDKPDPDESPIKLMFSSAGITVTADGGENWYGLTPNGDMILRLLSTTGINADWIDTGTLVIRDNLGNVTFSADTHTGVVTIRASEFSLTNGDTLQSVASAAVSAANTYTNTQLNDYQATVYDLIGDIQDQIDGVVDTYYYAYMPTTSNYPANDWITNGTEEEHKGDLFLDTSTGKSYRWVKNNNVWQWKEIPDTASSQALLVAQNAYDLADQKRRIFVAQPTPPYDAGDLWVQGSNGDIMQCTNGRTTGNYTASDWVMASKYTDDTLVKAKYGTCATNADVAAKNVTLPGFKLYKGARITVFFSHSNTASNPTLNVNSTGAKAIYAKGAAITSTYYWRYTDIVDFVYDDSHWEMIVQDQREIFMRLTNGGSDQGIYLSNGKVYINAAYINTGELSATRVRGGYLSIGGSAGGNFKNGIIRVYNENDERVIQIDTNGIRVGNIASNLTSPHTTITPNGYIQTNRLRATGSVRAVGDADAIEKSLLRIPVVNTWETVGENCYFEVGDNGTTIKTLYEPNISSVSGLYGVRGATLKAGGILQRDLEDFWRIHQSKTVGGYVCVDTDTMTTNTVKNYSRLSPTELTIHTRAEDSELVLSPTGLEAYSYKNNVLIDTYFIRSDSFQLTVGSGKSGIIIGDLTVTGDLHVGGAKPRVVKTDDYADRTLYCYETASPLFGDVGEGIINEDGRCYIFIDPILSETIQTSQYQVFLQKYGNGDCYVSERKTDHFVVTGTPGMQFGWELKAKQFDLTQKRLDKYDTREHSLNMGNKINYASDAERHIIEIMNERMAQNEYSNFGNNI